jgi:hypothetical protein
MRSIYASVLLIGSIVSALRLKAIHTSATDFALNIAGGYPGSNNVIADYILEYRKKGYPGGDFLALMTMDTAEVYDDKIVLLYQDVCKRNIFCFDLVMEAVLHQTMTKQQLHYAINNKGQGFDLKKVSADFNRYRKEFEKAVSKEEMTPKQLSEMLAKLDEQKKEYIL